MIEGVRVWKRVLAFPTVLRTARRSQATEGWSDFDRDAPGDYWGLWQVEASSQLGELRFGRQALSPFLLSAGFG